MVALAPAPYVTSYYGSQVVPKAVLATRIAALTAKDWRIPFAAAVAHRELGVSQALRHPDSPEFALVSYDQASRYYQLALTRASQTLNDTDYSLAVWCISADAYFVDALKAALQNNADGLKVAAQALTVCIRWLDSLLKRVTPKPAKAEIEAPELEHEPQGRELTLAEQVLHTLLIAHTLAGRVQQLQHQPARASFYFASGEWFKTTLSPDGEKAYRSLLFYWAQVQQAQQQYAQALGTLRKAALSAWRHRDRQHLVRAIAIATAGTYGDNALRRLRDRGC